MPIHPILSIYHTNFESENRQIAATINQVQVGSGDLLGSPVAVH